MAGREANAVLGRAQDRSGGTRTELAGEGLPARRADESSSPTYASPICRYLAVVLAALAQGVPRDEVLAPADPRGTGPGA
jgi:hypothetical protein